MARFLLVTLPMTGHVNPMRPVARRLVERGHDVRWYTGSRFREQVEAAGAGYLPMIEGDDFDDRDLDRAFPERGRRSHYGQVKFDFRYLFIRDSFSQLRDLQRIVAGFPPDVVVTEMTSAGPKMLHELGGPPFATISTTALATSSRDTAPFGTRLPPVTSRLGRLRNRLLYLGADWVIFPREMAYYNRLRAGVGLPPYRGSAYDVFASPYLFLLPTVPEFEYPRRDLPRTVHFVGPLVPDAPPGYEPPGWWPEIERHAQPIVHVTAGTWATKSGRLVSRTPRALAGEDVLVVATTGGAAEPALPRLPENARVARYVPHRLLLPHTDVMVTNGGYGGVTAALAHGVPLVVAAATEEKPETAQRVAWAGVGINLRTGTPSPASIRAAVRRVLTEQRYRQRARQIAASMARHDAPAEVAQLLEQLARTGLPVQR